MKKYIFVFIFMIIGMAAVYAQRMLPKQRGLEISTGILSDKKIGREYYLNMAMTVYGKNGNYQIWALEYNHKYALYKNINIPIETYFVESGYSLQLLADTRKTVTLNLGITGVLGYETVNRGKNLLDDGAIIRSEDGFVYGAGGRLSLETHLSDRFVLLLQGKAKVLWGTSMEQFRPSAGLGIRFNF